MMRLWHLFQRCRRFITHALWVVPSMMIEAYWTLCNISGIDDNILVSILGDPPVCSSSLP